MKNFIKGVLVLWTILTTISAFTAFKMIDELREELRSSRRRAPITYRDYYNNR